MGKVIRAIFWIFLLILFICLPATLVKYFSEGGSIYTIFFDVLKVVGAFLGVGFAITIPIFCVGLLVEKALKNKNAAIYAILEAVNAIFIVFLGLIGLYFVIAGLTNIVQLSF